MGLVNIHYRPRPPKRNRSIDDAEEPVNPDIIDDDQVDDYNDGRLVFAPDQLQGMDDKTGVFWYWNEEKQAKLILTKKANYRLGGNMSMLQKLSSLRASGAN